MVDFFGWSVWNRNKPAERLARQSGQPWRFIPVTPEVEAEYLEKLAMPTGPKGERRPADVIGNAVHVMKIATGEIEDTQRDPAKELHRKGGLKGGKARAKTLSPEQRHEIASKAASARWKKAEG